MALVVVLGASAAGGCWHVVDWPCRKALSVHETEAAARAAAGLPGRPPAAVFFPPVLIGQEQPTWTARRSRRDRAPTQESRWLYSNDPFHKPKSLTMRTAV